MAYGNNKQLGIGLNVALAGLFTIASVGTYSWLDSKFSDNDQAGNLPISMEAVSVEELPIINIDEQGMDPLNRYYGTNEKIEIILAPSDIRSLLADHRFTKFHDDFYSVRDDYLFKTKDGDLLGFDQLSGMIYDHGSVDARTGQRPLSQLISVKKALDKFNDLSGSLLPENQLADSKVAKQDTLQINKEKSKKANIAQANESISQEEIKDLFESSFKKTSKEDGESPKATSSAPTVESIDSQKIADIEKLRAELKKRVEKDFGYIPNAQAQIESHLGGSEAMTSEPPQNEDASDVRANQVNVRAIRETRNAVIYKGERIPKAGFDLDGNPVSEQAKRAQVKGIMDRIVQMDDYWSVVYKAKGEEKKKIAVFSDPTCPYCKKLHEYVPELQEAGVTVYHLFYNRAMAPNTVNDPKVVKVNNALESAWCSDNPNEAIDSLYEGYSIPPATCDSTDEKIEFPGNEHYLMGRIIDMSGTPYTITEDGLIIPGFDIKGAPQPSAFLRAIGL